jgi:solute carrier family 25 (mitochondrial phosphate transporter), member 23/24/25/41
MQAIGSRKQNITIKSGFKHMLNEGGLLALWRGNGINIIKIAPEAATKFMFYEEIKKIVTNSDNHELTITIGERFLSGSLAGVCAQSIIYPLEVLKTRLVLRKTNEYINIFDCIHKIYTNESPRAFYKGFLPNILGIIPYAGTDLAVYETLKNLFIKHYNYKNNNNQNNHNKTPSIPILLLCGTLSTISGQLVSYPLALIRTRLQAQEIHMNSLDKDTMTKLFKNIYFNEGIRGLYRGLLPNMIKVVPAVSISYVVYENIKRKLIDSSLSSSSSSSSVKS